MRLSRDERGMGHILVLLLILVVVGAVGFAGWRVYASGQKPKTPADIVRAIQQDLSGKYKVVSSDASSESFTSPKKGTINVAVDSVGPFWKSNGYNYLVSSDKGSAIYIAYYARSTSTNTADQPASKAIANIITKRFAQAGLKKTANPAGQTYNGLSDSSATYYKNDTIVCMTDAGGEPVWATCATIADAAASAATFQPFGAAYMKSSEYKKSDVVEFTGTPSLEASKTPGYQTARVGMGPFLGLYYRKDAGQWNYFTGVQGEISCSEYNTPDIRLAFAGSSCFDETTQHESTVR